MKKIIFLLAAIWALSWTEAFAQTTICTAGINDTIGSTVTGTFVFDRFPKHLNFTIQIQVSGGENAQWDDGTRSCSPGCHMGFHWISTSSSELLSAVITEGDPSGARCHFENINVTAPVFTVQLPQAVKDAAKAKLDTATWWRDRVSPSSYQEYFICQILGTQPCALTDVARWLLDTHIQAMSDIWLDPPDAANCYVGADLRIPDASEFGWYYTGADPWGDDVLPSNLNAMTYHATVMKGVGQFIYDSTNRASGCAQLGDSGMAQIQLNNAQVGLQWYRDHAAAASDNAYVLSNLFYSRWNPVVDWNWPCDASNWDYYARRPDVEQDGYYGPGGPFGANGALQHYFDYGQYEGTYYDGTQCPALFDVGWWLHAQGDVLRSDDLVQ